ncbi:BnaA04g27620D [Brassica napus]|uniref:(rape) hypothetical protein n=1 Tax=Brassica napus TaxID=3708 RepID=A0A078JC27_BRANA|nr:unnamed protein product [Brassica napus]CDY61758.1 BnaA04g27620D [Brassica napus]
MLNIIQRREVYHNSVLLFSLTWRLTTHAMLEKIQMSQ